MIFVLFLLCVVRRCFEVLGYDVMIDANLNPWIIEVNHLPRYECIDLANIWCFRSYFTIF